MNRDKTSFSIGKSKYYRKNAHRQNNRIFFIIYILQIPSVNSSHLEKIKNKNTSEKIMEGNQSQHSESVSGIDSIRPISNESFSHILQPQQSTAISNAAAAAALSNYTRMLNFQNQLNLISLAGPTMELNPLALAWNNRSESIIAEQSAD